MFFEKIFSFPDVLISVSIVHRYLLPYFTIRNSVEKQMLQKAKGLKQAESKGWSNRQNTWAERFWVAINP